MDASIQQKEAHLATLENKAELLSAKVNTALQELALATTRHEQFIEYEKTARKILEAKDAELVDRQSSLSQDEATMRQRRSFLPKM